jgi:hypothetical protein
MSEPMQFGIQPLAWVVKPKGHTVDGETSTTITRTHEGDGQFIVVSQFGGEIHITLEEWPAIKLAIETAVDVILADELHEFAPEVPK